MVVDPFTTKLCYMLPSIGIPNTKIFCYGIMDVKFFMINIHFFKLILMKMYFFIQKNNMSFVEREKRTSI